MLKLAIGYPSLEDEAEILRRRRQRMQEEVTLRPVVELDELSASRAVVETIHVDNDIETYIAALVHATRQDQRVSVGASPRGALAFLKLARAWAALDGRDYVVPDDVKRFAEAVLGHRLILQPEYWMSQSVTGDVIRDVLEKTQVPVIS
jgi:MoxR-like ATPase